MKFTQIQYELRDNVAIVTLNRPERLNAWTGVMAQELRSAMELANADPTVRAIILTGAGRGFCSGFDMSGLSEIAGDDRGQRRSSPIDPSSREDFNHPMAYFPAIRKPVIAAVNGPAVGMGLVLSIYCDMRFVSREASFVTAFARRGLIAEFGSAWVLSRLIGHSRALDLFLSSRKVSAEEAFRLGLADRTFSQEELLPQTSAYASDLAQFSSPRSMRILKRQVWNGLFQTLEESLQEADREMAESLKSDHFREGVAHFTERRPPAWPAD